MNQIKSSIKEKVGNYFGLPVGNTSYQLYLSAMNESGKITARCLLDLMMIVLESVDELEKKE